MNIENVLEEHGSIGFMENFNNTANKKGTATANCCGSSVKI
jgi:hypothetical protein